MTVYLDCFFIQCLIMNRSRRAMLEFSAPIEQPATISDL